MTQHKDLTLPEDIHYTKLASTAGAGTVLRYTGSGTEEAAQAQLGHLNLDLGVASTYTLSAAQYGSASIRFYGTTSGCTVTLPSDIGPILVENALSTGASISIASTAEGGATVSLAGGQRQLVVVRGGSVAGFLNARREGVLEIDMTGRSSYLVDAGDAAYACLRFTGAPTANASVGIPDGWGGMVENAMSGTYTLTLARAAGSPTYALKRGAAVLVEVDAEGIFTLPLDARQGHLDVSVDGLSALTLSEAQGRAASLRFTGALTANCVVTVPDTFDPVVLENATTGAYTLTFSRVSGGTALKVIQGRKVYVTAYGNALVSLVPDLPTGHQDISLEGLSAKTLSDAQCLAASIRFTGALTANCIVTVPDDLGPLVVENATTGAYTLTLSRASGGTTLAVTQTKRVLVLARTGAVVACGSEV